MSYRILGTNHTSFTVSNLERTVGFYRDVLGFELTSKAPRDPQLIEHITGVEGADIVTAFLRGPGHTMEFIEYRKPEARGAVKARPCDTGFAHIAFNVDRIEPAIEKAKLYGVSPVAAPCEINAGPNKGRKVVYLRDWDGITIELIQVREGK